VFRDQPEDVLESRESAKQHLTKVSRVGMLVEQMQATLAQPSDRHRKDGPSSSSPLPDKGIFGDGPVISPTARSQKHDRHHNPEQDNVGIDGSQSYRRSQGPQRNEADDNILPAESASQSCVTAQAHPTRLEPIDEDFGDVDFDDFEEDMDITAEDLDAAVPLFVARPSQINQQRLSPEPRFVPPRIPPQLNTSATRAPPRKPAPLMTHDDDDEFGDLDEDDEFGDLDLDEDSFAAAEVAATQAYHASAATQGSVRISNLSRI